MHPVVEYYYRVFFMKYKRLTQEQFHELHEEFATFLATQSIDAKEWEHIKEKKPEVMEEELDIFSDLVWDKVLEKAEYLESIFPQHMYLFHAATTQLELIGLKILSEDIDLTTGQGFEWLRNNLLDDKVEIFEAQKAYSEEPKADIFQLIEQGAQITKGDLFRYFEKLVG